jgi:hypothetical protein
LDINLSLFNWSQPMCGKFTQMASWREVHELSNLFGARVDDQVQTFTPMLAVPVVHLDSNGDRLSSASVTRACARLRGGIACYGSVKHHNHRGCGGCFDLAHALGRSRDGPGPMMDART